MLHPKIRQKLVDLILFLWPIMPNSARVWAFMNDGELVGDYKFNNKDE